MEGAGDTSVNMDLTERRLKMSKELSERMANYRRSRGATTRVSPVAKPGLTREPLVARSTNEGTVSPSTSNRTRAEDDNEQPARDVVGIQTKVTTEKKSIDAQIMREKFEAMELDKSNLESEKAQVDALKKALQAHQRRLAAQNQKLEKDREDLAARENKMTQDLTKLSMEKKDIEIILEKIEHDQKKNQIEYRQLAVCQKDLGVTREKLSQDRKEIEASREKLAIEQQQFATERERFAIQQKGAELKQEQLIAEQKKLNKSNEKLAAAQKEFDAQRDKVTIKLEDMDVKEGALQDLEENLFHEAMRIETSRTELQMFKEALNCKWKATIQKISGVLFSLEEFGVSGLGGSIEEK